MRELCSDISGYVYYGFKKNKNTKNSYDLTYGPHPTELQYVIISEPIKPYLRANGATKVIECFQNSDRYFFSGLIHLFGDFFFGDVKNKVRKSNHLILVCLTSGYVDLWVFKFVLNDNAARKEYLIERLRANHSNMIHPKSVQIFRT